ncbi:similar to DUF985 domain-containing protein [Plenodomus lingam JN3]|uniref:Similar to DUF985 domain-containing protein n=2 Tax=Leptosphaeria maculans TaxID=5022 RepID=E5A5W5_LEPMJ|nr:similar to DUF985 domain-containing protein [Plenodomus lingam JN3]CBX99010.1 similar to DUF985 domain-containing protein [Plenodomus lingam JN3]
MPPSSIPNLPAKLEPVFTPRPGVQEAQGTQAVVQALGLVEHVEGGWFAEIDRSPLVIGNPFLHTSKEAGRGGDGTAITPTASTTPTSTLPLSGNNAVRNASTSIYYLLTRNNPQGHFHRNKARTVHTVIQGRGRYVLIHGDEEDEGGRGDKAGIRVESFVVGSNVAKGERAVWVVEGGKWKASFLLGGEEGDEARLLISETVVPGFEYADHDFLTMGRLEQLLGEEQVRELGWLVRKA